MRMSFPLLASLGVRLEKENLYNNLLAAVKEKNLGRDVITNQFVSEISDAMGKRAQGHSVQSSGLMTAKQACHILALIVDQVKFPTEDSITKGSLPTPKRMNFWKSSKRGGGHFQSKNFCCKSPLCGDHKLDRLRDNF